MNRAKSTESGTAQEGVGGIRMIKSIDIAQFGAFKGFMWRDSFHGDSKATEFRRLNILYGRNYSGKTTLSRIMRSFQEHTLPDNYEAPQFKITTESGTFDQTMVTSSNLDIRVYNKDFVNDHLSFLTDREGNITPFAIVGDENKLIQQQIDLVGQELGSADKETGLRHKLALKCAEFEQKQKLVTKAQHDLKAKLTDKATKPPGGIKHSSIYRDPNYNTPKIEADIEAIRKTSAPILSEEQRQERLALLSETGLPSIKQTFQFVPLAKNLYEQAKELLAKRVAPTQPIQDLLSDSLLQAWAKEGIQYHKGKRKTCGFCGQPLPADLWDKLDAHFSRESEDLSSALGEQVKALEAEVERSRGVLTLKEQDFYSSYRSVFQELKRNLDSQVKHYMSSLEETIKMLKARQNDIFTSQSLPDLSNNSAEIIDCIAKINTLIEQNNKTSLSLANDQAKARQELRLSEIAQFILDIGLSEAEKRIAKLESDANQVKKEQDELLRQVQALEQRVLELLAQVKDEKKGAEKINEYLSHFLGNNKLKLEAIGDSNGSTMHFKILRGTVPAYNLSEGECSLVAFCYFLAKLEDAETKGKELIIYIDDPVSSLDSNHIFFVFSLIESVLAKPIKGRDNLLRYRQMFISTHNLDFLKYLKRLSHPKKEQGGTAYFLVERPGEHSALSPMPVYMQKYVTEFNYLFHQIYRCRDANNAQANYECFYNFGNNLRKFLEAYLFYRYPVEERTSNERLRMFFGDDSVSTALTNRLANELSHLEEIFDRSMRPIEIPEIPALATFVLEKIRERDPDQYTALLESIGELPAERQAEHKSAAKDKRSGPSPTYEEVAATRSEQ